MERRDFVSGIFTGTVAVGGGYGVLEIVDRELAVSDEEETRNQTVEEPPQEVETVVPLGEEFHHRMLTDYPQSSVYITPKSELYFEFDPSKGSGKALRKEIDQIAVVYANVVEQQSVEPVTLTMVVDKVQAVVPKASVVAFNSGKVDEEAYTEMIGVMDVERNNDS